MATRERKTGPRTWQRGLFVHEAISESIWIIVDAMRLAGNQAMNAVQTIVNRTPKDRATNELYVRTSNIDWSLYFADTVNGAEPPFVAYGGSASVKRSQKKRPTPAFPFNLPIWLRWMKPRTRWQSNLNARAQIDDKIAAI